MQANQRVEEFKAQLKELKVKLKAAEKRAIIAEKTVKIFTKEMDKREGNNRVIFTFYRFLNFQACERWIPIVIDKLSFTF